MRTLWVMGILLALGARPAAAQYPGDVSAQYDRFENQTVVSLSGADVGNALKFGALYFMPGKVPSIPKLVGIRITTMAKDWTYLKCHRLAMLADDARVTMADASHEGTVRDGHVIEEITAFVSVATLNKLVRAQKVEGRLCDTEFSLSPMQISALKDFADQMRPARR